MQIIIDKLLINYQDLGSGKLVILVHGWGDNLKSFNDLQKQLAKTFRVISLDLPGFGGSSAPETGWSLDDYAVFINSFVDKIGVSVYSYIGHSNGGAILIKGLANNIIESQKLILIAASGIRDTEKLKKKLIYIGAKIGKLPLKLLPTDYQRGLQKRLYQAIKSDAAVSPKMIQTFRKIVKQDVSEDALRLKTATLLIYGADDKVTPLEFGQIYHKLIKNSRLNIIDSAGHFVHLQEINKVQGLIEDYLI